MLWLTFCLDKEHIVVLWLILCLDKEHIVVLWLILCLDKEHNVVLWLILCLDKEQNKFNKCKVARSYQSTKTDTMNSKQSSCLN